MTPNLDTQAMAVSTHTRRLAGHIFLAGFCFGAFCLFVTLLIIGLAEGY